MLTVYNCFSTVLESFRVALKEEKPQLVVFSHHGGEEDA